VLGGAEGMVGAALLASRAALAAGAGRCYVHLCAPPAIRFDTLQPELMLRPAAAIRGLQAAPQATVLAGCGGGEAVIEWLAPAMALAPRLVLDADALNAIAADAMLQRLLQQRGARGRPSVLTPHPLEAARLLGSTTAEVQADRRRAAQALAERFGAVVVLKGSGTLVAARGRTLRVNPTGDARLSTAGTGDVLAGWTAGLWASQPVAEVDDPDAATAQAGEVAAAAVFLHGAACAPEASTALPVLASALIPAMVRTVEQRTAAAVR